MLTQGKLKEIISYDPETGLITWIKNIYRKNNIGKIAGGISAEGYIKITINSKQYQAHQLIWFYMTGLWVDEIDHDNRVRSDNRWLNLKEATREENQHNRTINKNNKSGISGVSWHESKEKWQSMICVEGEQKYLGQFKDINLAIQARKDAETKYGYKPD